MYCRFCGNELFKEDTFCPNCGKKVWQGDKGKKDESRDKEETVKEKEPSFAWAFFSFLFPLFGLVIFYVYQYDKPKRAKSAGKSALISVIIEILLAVILLFSLNLLK